MENWDNIIDEKKVFLDLFNIYEQELLTIFQYVAPIGKMKVSSNKIHELHMRVCAECENLAVKVVEQFIPKDEYQKKFWEEKKEFILEDGNNFLFLWDDAKEQHNLIREIFKKMDSSELTKLIQWLFKYPDMPFYIWILNKILWLCSKKIEFCQMMEIRPERHYKIIQPFELKWNQKIPLWRTNYNKIKHNKIINYKNCALKDLINSLWAYYILLNYFSLNIKLPVYDNIEIKSKIFKPTIGRLEYPMDISVYYAQYRENKPWFIKDVYIWDKRIIPWYYYDDNKKEEIQKKLDEAFEKFILHDLVSEENNNHLNNENYFFYYSYKQQGVIIQNYINNNTIQQPWWTLKMEKRFNLPR